jgi:hypothetical protein
MKRVQVKKKNDVWVAETDHETLVAATTKKEAVQRITELAQRDGGPMSVVIRGMNGHIQEERTYPRGADPRRSKG